VISRLPSEATKSDISDVTHDLVFLLDVGKGAERKLADNWSNVVPGDEAPAGQPAVREPGSSARSGPRRLPC
jgi:hypothetical protein